MSSVKYEFRYMPLIGKLSGESMLQQTEQAINEIAKIVNENTAQADIINTLAQDANNNSVEALEKANEALETSGRVYLKETRAVDLDNYCESQLIYVNNTASRNLPVAHKGFLEVKTNDDKTQATQVFVDDVDKIIYIRTGKVTAQPVGDVINYVASYGDWVEIPTIDLLNSLYLPLSGGTLTGVVNGVTPAAGDNSTKIATTEFVNAKVGNYLPSTAAAHNSIYRGKDLTAYWNGGGMSKAIKAGTFDDIFPGDYIIKSVTVDGKAYSNIKWIVGDLDYFLHRGVTETAEHHLILFPENNIGTAQMNSTNTTANGYQGSDMWKNVIHKYTTGIVSAFGSDHVLEHDELLTNAMNANAASAAGAGWMGSAYWNWTGSYGKTDGSYPWVKVKVNIFNQAMMFGNHPFASSGQEEGNCNKQLAAFRYGQNFTRANWCWLRDVASANYFADVSGNGFATHNNASNVGGVRPYFLLY